VDEVWRCGRKATKYPSTPPAYIYARCGGVVVWVKWGVVARCGRCGRFGRKRGEADETE
jgi:hypothetical protein